MAVYIPTQSVFYLIVSNNLNEVSSGYMCNDKYKNVTIRIDAKRLNETPRIAYIHLLCITMVNEHPDLPFQPNIGNNTCDAHNIMYVVEVVSGDDDVTPTYFAKIVT